MGSPSELAHLTFTTGHLRMSPRSEVCRSTVETLVADIAARRSLGGTEWTALIDRLDAGCWSYRIRYAGITVAHAVLCLDASKLDRCWQETSKWMTMGASIPDMPHSPYLVCAISEPGSVAMVRLFPSECTDIMMQLGDLERCIAWALAECDPQFARPL